MTPEQATLLEELLLDYVLWLEQQDGAFLALSADSVTQFEGKEVNRHVWQREA